MAGFECEFVEKPPVAFQFECPICLLVLREPYQVTCCGKSFCKECIDRIKAANQACPTCNKGDFTMFPNLGLQQSLYDFRVYCTHKSKGCEWTGELRELDNHLNSDPPADLLFKGCPFTLLKCPLSCADHVFLRKDIKSHVSDNLEKFLSHFISIKQENSHLKEQMEITEREKLYLDQENTQLKVQMANNEGEKLHLEQCVRELEDKVGEINELELKKLMTKLKREMKERSERLSSIEGENQYLEQQVTELKTKVSQLNKEAIIKKLEEDMVIASRPPRPEQPLSVSGTYKPKVEFTMTDFEQYRRDNDHWHSPHFYTHPNGYKMCLRVYPNGYVYGPGKGTHLSVFVFLMKGEFDDQLKWPFQGEITIQLVNQKEDKDHVVKTLRLTKSNLVLPPKCCERVTIGDRSDSGWGEHQFLPLTELQPKYLKNDCIKLYIKTVYLL